MDEGGSPLLVGPLLRYVDQTSATVWVEIAHRGTVTVRAADRAYEAHTFTVHGHHYAVVDITDLEPGGSYPYAVLVDADQVWPPAGSSHPPSRIRTFSTDQTSRIAFGSCRTSAAHDAEAHRSHGPDVLRALALQLATSDTDESTWPSLLLLLGDQVYADSTNEEMREFIASRRDIDRPKANELQSYDEYAHLYRMSWNDPDCRWLLSTVSSAMIFDDHDIHDDWNTSAAWRTLAKQVAWWQRHIEAGLASYWIYQHLGNLSPKERGDDSVWSEVVSTGRDGDAGVVVDALARRADADPAAYRWSYHRDFGKVRLIMVDARAARVLDESGRRMVDKATHNWLDDLLTGDIDHLLIGTSLPYLVPMGLHHLEAWNEAVAGGAWGRRAAKLGERIRRMIDLEHWAAFQYSFRDVGRGVVEVATGHRGAPPATVLFLSGDVHHSYLADVGFGRDGESRLLQAVCSPIRNTLPRWERWVAATTAHGLAPPMRVLASRAGVAKPPFDWTIAEGPWFDNAIATLEIDGRRAALRWETADVDDTQSTALRRLGSVEVSDR
jgi:PhoD-like phosphatase